MTQEYAKQPAAVEVFPLPDGKTDVIIRENIVQIEKAGEEGGTYTAWQCDETQFRYPGNLTAAEIEADLETWVNYEPEKTVELTEEDEMDAMLLDHEYRLTLLEMGE